MLARELEPGHVELVVAEDRETKVYRLTYERLELLCVQLPRFLARWPGR